MSGLYGSVLGNKVAKVFSGIALSACGRLSVMLSCRRICSIWLCRNISFNICFVKWVRFY